jgi:hypothetical protein
MQEIGKISNVSIIEGVRDRRTGRIPSLNGLVLEFKTDFLVQKNNIITFTFDNHYQYFRIAEIEIDGTEFLCKCVEYGYWVKQLKKKENLDIRKLIGISINLIEDKNLLKKLREESLWT